MDLINQTLVPALVKVALAPGDDPTHRQGLLVAKATFRVHGDGSVELDDDPLPVLEADEETDVGVLPRDLVLRRGPSCDLALLGHAMAPGRRTTRAMEVELLVGDVHRRLRVTGDRFWLPDGTPSEPEPFLRMPLSWDRSFGGRTDVWLDPSAPIEVTEPTNPRGRGFDPAPQAVGLGETLGAPEGYPRWDRTRRLPNIEDPAQAVRRPDDRPTPAGWAPLPVDLLALSPSAPSVRVTASMVLPEAPLGLPVRVRGVRPGGDWAFVLPPLAVHADFHVADRRGSRALVPQALLLLPDESRVAITYRLDFQTRLAASDERSLRLRLENHEEASHAA